MQVHDLEGDGEVSRRLRDGTEAVVRSRPYNAKGKPGIEGAFGNLEQFFRHHHRLGGQKPVT